MKKDLKSAIADKFEAVELSDDQFAALEQTLARKETQLEEAPKKSNTIVYWRAMAASVVIIFGLMAFFTNSAYHSYRSNEIITAIANETVKNHINLKPLEVRSAQLGEVLGYFSKLEFQPVMSKAITKAPGYKLLGGRYCSIRGISAAQLRTVSLNGKVSSWFQGMLSPEELEYIPNVDKGGLPAVRSMKGLQVLVWQEGGVVFVRVR